jgi:2-polyprenyl-3-methyl-5-hydroxy-6-metoxy-1,4-benzoquinol methylase
MLRDRLTKHGWYDTPDYWDMKAETYEGLARSNWPSNTYNRHWDGRQMQLIDAVLGDVEGLEIADIACGTGRASRHMARRGAKVTGLDFAPRTLDAARRETEAEGLSISYRHYDALVPPPDDLVGRFDAGLTISCLAMACADVQTFDRALGYISSLVKPGGRLLLFEPIHTSRLLKRILKMSTAEWIERAAGHGLVLLDRRSMGFVPVRLSLAFRDLPDRLVGPAFWAGERLLDAAPPLERLSDYKCLLFRREVRP